MRNPLLTAYGSAFRFAVPTMIGVSIAQYFLGAYGRTHVWPQVALDMVILLGIALLFTPIEYHRLKTQRTIFIRD